MYSFYYITYIFILMVVRYKQMFRLNTEKSFIYVPSKEYYEIWKYIFPKLNPEVYLYPADVYI